MAIRVITGKPRHGKTYYMAYLACKFLKNGVRIYSNVKLVLGKGALKKFDESIVGDIRKKEDLDNPKKLLFYWNHIHQWEHMNQGVILVDEMTRYFNARLWDSLSEETIIKLQQHGKEDLDIYGTVQHYSRIDVAVRQLVEKYFIVTTIFGNPDNKKPFLGLKRFSFVELDLEDIDDYYYSIKHPDQKIELDINSFGLWYRKKYGMIYDTRAKVGSSESMPLVHKKRICQICGKEEVKHY